MNGWSYDYMLALDNENCKKRGDAWAAKAETWKKAAADLATAASPKLSPFFDANGGAETVCNYVNWAYTESVDLNTKFEDDTGVTLDTAWNTCNSIGKAFVQG